MAHSLHSIALPALLTAAALTAAMLTAACTNQVVSGSEEDTGSAGGSGGTEPKAEACAKEGATRDCGSGIFISHGGSPTPTSSGSSSPGGDGEWIYGVQSCERGDDGSLAWGTCVGPNTPLVLSFDRAPVQFAASADRYGFDLSGSMSIATDWPAASTPWLALDRDGDGRIGSGAELFGSATALAGGGQAPNGFIALRDLDSNGDGRITPEDAAWSKLLLWSDRDGDRTSKAGELTPVSARKLLSIELAYTSEARCDARGNCEYERATFRYLDDAGVERTGDIIDVHLKAQ